MNMQLHAPGDDGERDDGERLQAILARWGSCPIADGRVARRSRTSQASLDILAVPGWDALVMEYEGLLAQRPLRPRLQLGMALG